MDLVIRLVAEAVVPLFFFGMAGSAIVIAVGVVQDLNDFFEDEE